MKNSIHKQAKAGPTGLGLIVDLLRWSPTRVALSQFKEKSTQRFLLYRLIRRAEVRKDHNWKDELKKLQNEIKQDLLSLLEPVQLTKEEFDEHNSVHPTFFPDPLCTPRQNRLWLLLAKLLSFQWSRYLAPGLLIGGHGINFRVGGDSDWHPIVGEMARAETSFEIMGERLWVVENPRFDRFDVREALYFAIYSALRSGEIAKLRICKYDRCRRIFLAKRKRSPGSHCSERCRTRFNYDVSKEKFHRTYEADRKNALESAKRKFLARVNQGIDSAMQSVLNGKAPPIGAKKEFKKFVEEYRLQHEEEL
jgi:hypothetical protein